MRSGLTASRHDLTGDGPCVGGGEVFKKVRGVEAAVGALALAERYVDVDARLLHLESIAEGGRRGLAPSSRVVLGTAFFGRFVGGRAYNPASHNLKPWVLNCLLYFMSWAMEQKQKARTIT